MLELAEHRTHQSVALLIDILLLRQLARHNLIKLLIICIMNNFGPFHSFNQHTDRAVRKLQHLPHIGNSTDPKNIFLSRLLNIHF
ncbi:hypothetical protein D3C80_1444560 [compost metagenome]